MVRLMENEYELSWLLIIGTFSTDIFAYFIGKFFGKKKLLPKISPNKTVAGCMEEFQTYCLHSSFGVIYINGYSGLHLNILHYLIMVYCVERFLSWVTGQLLQ